MAGTAAAQSAIVIEADCVVASVYVSTSEAETGPESLVAVPKNASVVAVAAVELLITWPATMMLSATPVFGQVNGMPFVRIAPVMIPSAESALAE